MQSEPLPPSDLHPFVLSLAPDELISVQHDEAPYRGYYCVLTVHVDGRIGRGARCRSGRDSLARHAHPTLSQLADTPTVTPPMRWPFLGIQQSLPSGTIQQFTFAAAPSAAARQVATVMERAGLAANPRLDHGCGQT